MPRSVNLPVSRDGICKQHLPVFLDSRISRRDLIAKTVVFVAETLALLLESLNVAVLALELLLQTTNLAHVASLIETTAGLLGIGRSLKTLVLFLKTKDIKDHDVGAVENEGKEKGETTEVHIALRVELPGLDLHTLRAHCRCSGGRVSDCEKLERDLDLRGVARFGNVVQLDLHAEYAIHAVNEQDEDEDECYLLSDQIIVRVLIGRSHRTFIQYCILATIGFSAKKVKRPRFQVNGIGTMSVMKSTISKTRSAKT